MYGRRGTLDGVVRENPVRLSELMAIMSHDQHGTKQLEQYRLRLTNRAIKLLAKTKG
jgi:hypothetical protein